MKYHFKVHKEGKRFWAQCLELEGCITQAPSMKQLQKNMHEALSLYIQEPEDSAELASLPNPSIKKSKSIVEVALDPEIAFSFMVRYHRLKEGLTQKEAAKRMGFDSVFSYQRLEAKKCNPSLKTLSMIKQGFPHFSVDRTLNTFAPLLLILTTINVINNWLH